MIEGRVNLVRDGCMWIDFIATKPDILFSMLFFLGSLPTNTSNPGVYSNATFCIHFQGLSVSSFRAPAVPKAADALWRLDDDAESVG